MTKDEELKEARDILVKTLFEYQGEEGPTYCKDNTYDGETEPILKAMLAYHHHRLDTALPTPEWMYETEKRELDIQGKNPIGAYSVMSPRNFFRNGFQTCYFRMIEFINGQSSKPPKETK